MKNNNINTIVLVILLIICVSYIFIQSKKLDFFEEQFGTYKSINEQIDSQVRAQSEKEHNINIHLKSGATRSKGEEFVSQIKKLDGIESIVYISPEEELQEFKSRHSDDQATLDAVNQMGNNILGGQIKITIKNKEERETIANKIKSIDKESLIDTMNYTLMK